MNPSTVFQTIQQSYRIAVGATATLLETLQDPQKRGAAFSDLQEEWNQRSQEWSQKGEVTEQEARRTVEEWLHRQGRSQPASSPSNASSPTSRGKRDRTAQAEIKDLTEQIMALRTELEESRRSDA